MCEAIVGIFLTLILATSVGAQGASDNAFFERTLQKVGKNLDHAKVKGQEFSQKANAELKETIKDIKAEAASLSENADKDWKVRVKAALTELGTGMQRAWRKLKGEHDPT